MFDTHSIPGNEGITFAYGPFPFGAHVGKPFPCGNPALFLHLQPFDVREGIQMDYDVRVVDLVQSISIALGSFIQCPMYFGDDFFGFR